MHTHLFYYTGTGNSLWVARQLAAQLDGEVSLVPLRAGSRLPDSSGERRGLIFPVHIWGLPRRVVEFVGQFAGTPDSYHFAVAVNAGQVAASLLQLRKMLQQHGVQLKAGFSLRMPSNYILWNGAQPIMKQQALFEKAEQKIERIASIVRELISAPIEKGPWWQNSVLSFAYYFASSRVAAMDRDFWSEETCNSCGLCARVCPADNIRIQSGRPEWQHRCEQCLACIQWCPQQAIQFEKKTTGKTRYHHPAVTAAEMSAVPLQPEKW